MNAAIPLEFLDRELDRLCVFDGAEPAQQVSTNRKTFINLLVAKLTE